jgi:hypothetical protein
MIEKLFNKAKVVTINELKNTLDTDYSMTVSRYLKEVGYLSSYNKAGRFYTMPHIPRFDEYGLWHYKMASFSKHGTLKSTINSLINDSPEGFTHWELKHKLRCRVQNTLNDLTTNNVISREPINGLFVYLSLDKETALGQISQREKIKSGIETFEGGTIALPIIIDILLELLRSPAWDATTISKNLKGKKVFVTKQQIEEVLRIYNLKKKL